jgi:hypothetical protein
VAEEIEFLGGKAILENIFARSDMVRYGQTLSDEQLRYDGTLWN